MYREIYGTDGDDNPELVNVRIDLGMIDFLGGELFMLGRQIACRPSRDEHVKLGDGVVIIEGEFLPSGGSIKHPRLGEVKGIILEVRDVPMKVAERDCYVNKARILADEDKRAEALERERARLEIRIEEIGKELSLLSKSSVLKGESK